MATPLPPASDFTGSPVTEAQFKNALTNLRTFMADLLGTSGTNQAALQKLGALAGNEEVKTANYTVAVTDRGKIFESTGTFTYTLPPAATLGDGFSFIVYNAGTGVITIDPDSTELINGANTLAIAAGNWAIIYSTGAAIKALMSVTASEISKRYNSGEQTITSAGLLTLAHGLGVEPKLFKFTLVIKTAVNGYAVGDRVLINAAVSDNTSTGRGFSVKADATNIYVRFAQSANVFSGTTPINGTTGAVGVAYSNTDLRLEIQAFA